jgi:putative tryptophan/tyrosine transport system substrate-binding protein
MRRRDLIAMLGGAALAWPLDAGGQERRRIVILHSGFPRRTPIDRLYAALSERGYVEHQTAEIRLLGGEGDVDRLKTLVVEIMSRRPDVTIALTSPAVRALKDAGLTAPVVFAFVPDPVGQGIVASLAHPAGNFTGITYSETAIASKRLEVLLDAVPGTRQVAIIWGRGLPENAAMVKATQAAAQTRGLTIFSRGVGNVADLAVAFDRATASGATALVLLTDNLMFGRRKEIAELALSHHLPSIHAFSPEVGDGGLLSYGPDLEESYQRAAALADRILRGASPADLPVEEHTRFDLVINLKTAKAFGLAIPPTLLARADEVIE